MLSEKGEVVMRGASPLSTEHPLSSRDARSMGARGSGWRVVRGEVRSCSLMRTEPRPAVFAFPGSLWYSHLAHFRAGVRE